MRALDTNVLARWIMRDHEEQFHLAQLTIVAGAFVPMTVVMELEWVLRSVAGYSRDQIASALGAILELETLDFPDREALSKAIDEYRKGADWADLIHLIQTSAATTFLTFDRKLSRRPQTVSPVMVELIRA